MLGQLPAVVSVERAVWGGEQVTTGVGGMTCDYRGVLKTLSHHMFPPLRPWLQSHQFLIDGLWDMEKLRGPWIDLKKYYKF